MSDPSGWTDNLRSDGAELVKTDEGNFAVIGSTGGWFMTICPCCDKPFRTPQAAQLCANAVHPPT
jgi:hypothetical protein